MKKLLLPILLISVAGLFFLSSCKKDEEEEEKVKFSVTQEPAGANQVILKNETTGASCLWEWYQGTSTTPMGSSNDDNVTVNFAFAGDYTIKITVNLAEGAESRSENITVTSDDASLFSDPAWSNLTGGVSQEKSWVLDVDGKFFPGPLSFMGTDWDFVAKENDETADDAWMWNAPTSFTFELFDSTGWQHYKNLRMELPGDDGYGTMTFDLKGGYNFKADKKKEDPETGVYVLNLNEAKITLTGATILRSYKPYAEVNVDPNCTGNACAKKPDPVDGIAGISNWSDYMIYDLNDDTLRLAVSRDQDVQGEGTCWLIYNFIEKTTYESFVPEQFTWTEPVKTSFAAADLVGTWKYDEIAQDWIGWTGVGNKGTTYESKRLNSWSTRADMVSTLAGWGASTADSIFTANDAKEFVFNANGTCTLAGVANNYTVASGVITFTTALTNELSLVWIGLTGTTVSVLDVKLDNADNPYTYSGIWIGQKNGDKNESSCVHLVKK